MAEYTDFQLKSGDYMKAAEYYDEDAIILAIRNILLSRPGNFPFNPSIGMNIKKYQFELLDNETIKTIQRELNTELSKYLPDLGSIQAVVKRIDDNNDTYLGISISASYDSNAIVASFILKQDNDVVSVYNEIY